MTEPSLVSLFARPLNLLRVPYMVTGGVAPVVHGEPRFARDIDMVIDLRPAVMLGKLRHYRMGRSDRHLRDIHQMRRISGDLLDRATLGREVARLGLEAEWQQAGLLGAVARRPSAKDSPPRSRGLQ